MIRYFFILLFVFTFIQAKLQNKRVDSLSQPQLLNTEPLNHVEKIFRPETNVENKKIENLDCEESEITESPSAIRYEKTNQERITQYKKMIEELRGEKNKLESKGQNTSEIDRKIEKLQTLIQNLSK